MELARCGTNTGPYTAALHHLMRGIISNRIAQPGSERETVFAEASAAVAEPGR